MLHEKTPDQDGWYWVHQFDRHESDLWFMAFLKVEGLDDSVRPYLRLMNVDDEADYFGVENLRLDEDGQCDYGQIKHWIGPLSCPAGPFGGEIAEFTFERHMEAKAAGKALVMVHADVRDCSNVPGCCITTTGMVSGQEAYEKTSNFFKGQDKTKENGQGTLEVGTTATGASEGKRMTDEELNTMYRRVLNEEGTFKTTIRRMRELLKGKVTTARLARWLDVSVNQLCEWAPTPIPTTPPDFIERG